MDKKEFLWGKYFCFKAWNEELLQLMTNKIATPGKRHDTHVKICMTDRTYCDMQMIGFLKHSCKADGGSDTYNVYNKENLTGVFSYRNCIWTLSSVKKVVVMPPVRRRIAYQYVSVFDRGRMIAHRDYGLS